MLNSVDLLRQRYRATLAVSAILLLAGLFAYFRISYLAQLSSLRVEAHYQGTQLALALEDAIDVVRSHAFTAQRSIEHALERSGSGQPVSESLIKTEAGALLTDPNAEIDAETFNRDLSAVAAMLPGTAAIHQWNPIFQWTYYYDAGARWFLIFPAMTPEELQRVTRTGDMSAALKVYFDADGTQPLQYIGPRENPGRHLRWTRSYEDAGGKGRMVTLLAPVYLGNEFIGAIGTDVTLKLLTSVLRHHEPSLGRSMIINTANKNTVLADNEADDSAPEVQVRLSELFPRVEALPEDDDKSWLRFPLRGTEWVLLVHLSDEEMHAATLRDLKPSFESAMVLFAALVLLAWLQHRRYAGPALLLAEHVERTDIGSRLDNLRLPRIWKPLFERVSEAARERRELLQRARDDAQALELQVAARTNELSATSATLEQTRQELVRADKLGALGALVVGVSREVETPIRRSLESVSSLRGDVSMFRERQQVGLRRAELDSFVNDVEQMSDQLSAELVEAGDLLQRFRQLAVDQTSDDARRFRLREVAENVLAVLRPAMRRQGCEVDNRIGAELLLKADAGTVGQALTHVLRDALSRSAGACVFSLAAGWDDDAHGEFVGITLSDSGTSPPDVHGTELSLASGLVQRAMGGKLEVESAPGANRVVLRLPMVNEPS